MRVFHASFSNVIFHWGLSDSKCPNISRILQNIPADFTSVMIWIVSILTLASNSTRHVIRSSRPFRRQQLETVSPNETLEM